MFQINGIMFYLQAKLMKIKAFAQKNVTDIFTNI